jgi:hypothetical protein
MIPVPQPSVVIQAADVPWRYSMQYTPPPIADDASIEDVIAAALSPFRAHRDRLRCLVINAHGQAALIGLGRHGICLKNLEQFGNAIQGKFHRIEILSCNVARIQRDHVPWHMHPRWGPNAQPIRMRFLPGDGHHFCARLAQLSGAFVRAATEPQSHAQNHVVFPSGWIDNYEGLSVVYNPAGELIHTERTASFDDVAAANAGFEGWHFNGEVVRVPGSTAVWRQLRRNE